MKKVATNRNRQRQHRRRQIRQLHKIRRHRIYRPNENDNGELDGAVAAASELDHHLRPPSSQASSASEQNEPDGTVAVGYCGQQSLSNPIHYPYFTIINLHQQ